MLWLWLRVGGITAPGTPGTSSEPEPGVGWGSLGEPCPGPGPASRKRRVTTVRKISLVAPQQPLKQQRAGGHMDNSVSENYQIIAPQTQNRCIHNPKTKVKLRLRLTR